MTIQWVNTPGEKPKTFVASDTLAAGKVPIEGRLSVGQVRRNRMRGTEYMYRLVDVKVGHCVAIFYARIDGVDICDHIRILGRPDGLVPPLPEEAEELRDLHRKTREFYKARHPTEPLPEFLKQRPVPYHEWQNAYWARQAPMPREKGSVGPLMSP